MPIAAEASVKDPALAVARRGQIAATALRLFRERGYHSTTVREIAQAVGVSVGTLFNYFRSKEQILHFIYDQAHEPIEQALEEVLGVPGEDQPAALRRALDRFLTLIDRHQDHAILVYQEFKSLDGRAKRQVLDRERRIMGIFERIIRAGVAQGRFRHQPVAVTVNTIMVLGHAWALRRWAFKSSVSLEQFKAAQIEMVLAGLRPGPEER
jgi:AcrR family transcriptional regulator